MVLEQENDRPDVDELEARRNQQRKIDARAATAAQDVGRGAQALRDGGEDRRGIDVVEAKVVQQRVPDGPHLRIDLLRGAAAVERLITVETGERIVAQRHEIALGRDDDLEHGVVAWEHERGQPLAVQLVVAPFVGRQQRDRVGLGQDQPVFVALDTDEQGGPYAFVQRPGHPGGEPDGDVVGQIEHVMLHREGALIREGLVADLQPHLDAQMLESLGSSL